MALRFCRGPAFLPGPCVSAGALRFCRGPALLQDAGCVRAHVSSCTGDGSQAAGRALGFERAAAARYSFLLSIPAVVLSGLLERRKIGAGGGPGVFGTALATVIAFVVGYASIAFLLRFLTSNSTVVFVIYRVAMGLLVLGLVAGNVIN